MKYCSKCGQTIPDNAKFCSHCGEVIKTSEPAQESTTYYQSPAPVETSKTYTREDEQKHLDSLSNRLKWERIAWKVPGVIFLVLAIIYIAVSSIFGIIGLAVIVDNSQVNVESYYFDEYEDNDGYYYYNDYDTDTADAGFAFVGFYIWLLYFILGSMFLGIAIVNLVMAKKVKKYRDKLYTDCTDAVKHATSVGSIVLSAIFNNYAVIAVIINFILTKNNKEVFDRIQANQSAYNNAQL